MIYSLLHSGLGSLATYFISRSSNLRINWPTGRRSHSVFSFFTTVIVALTTSSLMELLLRNSHTTDCSSLATGCWNRKSCTVVSMSEGNACLLQVHSYRVRYSVDSFIILIFVKGSKFEAYYFPAESLFFFVAVTKKERSLILSNVRWHGRLGVHLEKFVTCTVF